MNMIVISNISVWIVLIITIFTLNRDRRESNGVIQEIIKLIDKNHINTSWFNIREEIEKKYLIFKK